MSRLHMELVIWNFMIIFKKSSQRFNPIFIVWGVSDGFILENSYLLNGVSPYLKLINSLTSTYTSTILPNWSRYWTL